MEQTIAIVGTAGRKDDAQKLYPEMFTAMVERTREAINLLENDPLAPPGAKLSHAVSGGAAWADHIAVRLFNKQAISQLTLHLPAPFDPARHRFHETGSGDWRTDPGRVANYYHGLFSRRLEINSLAELGQALRNGAQHTLVEDIGGSALYLRNSKVAKADALIALTFGKEGEVKNGGTADTVGKYLANRNRTGQAPWAMHIDLHNMRLHRPILLPRTYTELAKPKWRSTMYFAYGGSARPEITAQTTFDAIVNHERTATTRFPEDPGYDRWASLAVGDVIEVFENKDFTGRSALVRITQPANTIDFRKATPTDLENWSQKEGWSVNYAKTKAQEPARYRGVQISFELVHVRHHLRTTAPEPAATQPQLPLR